MLFGTEDSSVERGGCVEIGCGIPSADYLTDAGALCQISAEDKPSRKSSDCCVDESIWMTSGRPAKLSRNRASRCPSGLRQSLYSRRTFCVKESCAAWTCRYGFPSYPPFTASQRTLSDKRRDCAQKQLPVCM